MYALHDTVFSCKFLVINLPCRVGSVNNNNNNKDTYKQRSLKKNSRRAAGICHSVLRNRCVFRCRAKLAVDSDEKTQVGWGAVPNVWTGNSKVRATDGYGCPLHIQFAGGSRPQMPTSSNLNHRLAKFSQIRGC